MVYNKSPIEHNVTSLDNSVIEDSDRQLRGKDKDIFSLTPDINFKNINETVYQQITQPSNENLSRSEKRKKTKVDTTLNKKKNTELWQDSNEDINF
jgi:hypothetical protein